MVDWTRLRPGMRGLAVEGKTDKLIIEAFLDAGEKQGHWSNWRAVLSVEIAGEFQKVLSELEKQLPQVWGLVDRDWRAETELSLLQTQHPQLLVLPRVTIENYCIDPVELDALLPTNLRSPAIRSAIEAVLSEWIQHGALSLTLYENGAHQFCRGEKGFPRALIDSPVTDEAAILSHLIGWHNRLEPQSILVIYSAKLSAFQNRASDTYNLCIDGKKFFRQVVVRVLNNALGQRDVESWISDLFQSPTYCPADLIPVLARLF